MRNPRYHQVVFVVVVLSSTLLPESGRSADNSASSSPTFEVSFSREVQAGPISARVYVMLGPTRPLPGKPEPRFGPDWFRPQPFFAVDAKNWKQGEPLKIDKTATGYPVTLDRLEPGEYNAQAVVRLNPDTHKLGDGEGNAYGPIVRFTVDQKTPAPLIKLAVDHVVPQRVFPETDRVRLVELESPLLSAFHHRPIKHRAAVFLPEGDRAAKRAALYIIPGFGGDVFWGLKAINAGRIAYGTEMIRVVLDPDCGTGHHVFADSATNGPRGKALVEELIPYLEKTFPAIAEPRARLLNGHSSGGWSSLWLQVTYPDFFGGTWSTSPDPVDFRDFQRINLYAPGENMFRDREDNRRPIARMGARAILFYDNFSKMEDAIGDGGQLHSFEAVFSPLDKDSHPRRLWDRTTGAIHTEVAKTWEKYDIRLILEKQWQTLGPKLRGKIRVIMGDLDTFYLEGATKLLKESLAKLGSDAVVEIVPNRDHGNLLDTKLMRRLDQEMKDALARPSMNP